MAQEFITIGRFIAMEGRRFPQATGEFSSLMEEIILTCKVISREVTKAGLIDEISGFTGDVNVQGEKVRALDVYSNDLFKHILKFSGHVCAMASEEDEELIHGPTYTESGKYVVLLDPLDGSSNIDANVSIGSIFAIYRRKSEGGPGKKEDFLQPGRDLVASGYVLYGSSTMMVYTTGTGVHGFTLDPSVGTFILSHPNLKVPSKCGIYSVNEGNYHSWERGVQLYVDRCKGFGEEALEKPMSQRYIGSMVADFHRNLLYGGIFMYPGTRKKPQGKLRLMYEANPMAFLLKNAGGYASNGEMSILEIEPKDVHERTALFMGNRDEVETVERFIREHKGEPTPKGD